MHFRNLQHYGAFIFRVCHRSLDLKVHILFEIKNVCII
jgi:hypothetical protein